MTPLNIRSPSPSLMCVFINTPPLPQTGSRQLSGAPVYDQQNGKINDIVEKTDGGGIAVLGIYEADLISVSRDDLCDAYIQIVLHQKHLFKSHIHDLSHIQY